MREITTAKIGVTFFQWSAVPAYCLCLGVGIWIGSKASIGDGLGPDAGPALGAVCKPLGSPMDLQPRITNPPAHDDHIPAGYTAEWMMAWPALTKGLPSRQVRLMLGAPLRRKVGVVDEWYYVSDDESAWVIFYDDQVILWRRP
jgi:hypothetical protein